MVGILKQYCSIFILWAYFSGISTFNKYFIQWSMILYRVTGNECDLKYF